MASSSPPGQFPSDNIQYMKETIYILEDSKNGFLTAIPNAKEELETKLADYLPEKYLRKYTEVNGKIKYKTIPELVKLYNSKWKNPKIITVRQIIISITLDTFRMQTMTFYGVKEDEFRLTLILNRWQGLVGQN